jgi:hypothetical protein
MADYDKTQHAAPVQELAQVVYAIFCDYDGNAPDTCSLILCSTKELADAVLLILNKDPRRWTNLSAVEGYEWSKRFDQSRSYVALDRKVCRSVAEVFESIEDDEFPEESEAEEIEG